jgi:hypothetical protein
MSHKLDSSIAVIGIDIGKNSFHVVGHDKRGDHANNLDGGAAAEKTDHRIQRLLRARRERPCRRATEECDEVAPSHAKLPVEDKAYQRAALCVTAKLARR